MFSIPAIHAAPNPSDVRELLPVPGSIDFNSSDDEIKTNINSLPHGDLTTHFIPRIIDIILKISFMLATVSIIIAGILYIQAFGSENEGDRTKAKNILKYAVLGFVFISASYGIVQGILSLNVFD